MESQRVVLVSQRQNSSYDRVNYPSVCLVVVDDIAQSLDEGGVLHVSLLVVVFVLKRLALFNQHVENFESTYFQFQELGVKLHVVQDCHEVRQQKVGPQGLPREVDQIIGLV